MAQTSHKARILALQPGVVDPLARFLTSVIVIRPMLDYYLTLHDCETLEECTADNLVYKIDSGWQIGDNLPAPEEPSPTRRSPKGRSPKAKPPTQDPLAGDANSTGKSFTLNIPLDYGLTCSSCGQDGEFVVVYTQSA
jgi:hypothetical protein